MRATSWIRLPFARQLLAAVLITAVPLIVIGGLLFAFWLGQRRQLIIDVNQQQARLAAAFAGGWIESQERALSTLAASAEVRSGSHAKIQGLIERQLQAQPSWEDIFVTDTKGVIIASHIRTGVSVADRAYFREARDTRKPAVSNLLVSRLSGRPIINIAVAEPILRNGRFNGEIVTSISPQQLQEVFSSIPATQESVLALWGSDRRLIARSHTPATLIGTLYKGPYADTIFSGKTGTAVGRSTITGASMLVAYQPVPGTPWTVITGISTRQAFGPVYRAVITFGIASIVVLIGTLWWSFFITRRIAGELGKLADAVHTIGEGDFSTRITLPPGSDLSDIADAINRMTARLAISDKLKSDFLALVSHELRTPLTAIISAQELLPRTPETAGLIDIARRQAEHLRGMIDNLISYARVQAGTLKIQPRKFALRPLIERTIRHLSHEYSLNKLTITIEAPETLFVYADEQLTLLALHNLLDNAIKFTEQGSITIRTEEIDRQAKVSIMDTGMGFSRELADMLFQSFAQHEPLLTRQTEGTGLGLAVVKAVIEAQGGTVFAESPGPGQGSTFSFTLPLANGSRESGVSSPESS